ncbi:MAG: hypothetical protein DRJ38_04590 [Thermoprotei archaeon]|nr:MAG: hypothetical protein DRJ38_04590 [Thermoprotei archaeon]
MEPILIMKEEVQVKKLDGNIFSTSSDAYGRVLAEEIPKGILYVKVLSWKGMKLNTKWYEASLSSSTVVVDKIGLLRVRVIGERGQGIAGAAVYVENTPFSGSTGEDGVVEFLLPENSYKVKACLGETCDSATVKVTGSGIATIEVSLPVFLRISPQVMLSFRDFLFMAIFTVVIVAALFVIIYEYTVWRRKKMIKVMKSAEA